MADASLPDRVEAAAKAFNEYARSHSLPRVSPFDGSKWDVSTEEAIAVALAAADACEAERNPNPTDDPYVRCEYCGRWTWGFARRPVSSEDVHREAE